MRTKNDIVKDLNQSIQAWNNMIDIIIPELMKVLEKYEGRMVCKELLDDIDLMKKKFGLITNVYSNCISILLLNKNESVYKKFISIQIGKRDCVISTKVARKCLNANLENIKRGVESFKEARDNIDAYYKIALDYEKASVLYDGLPGCFRMQVELK